MSTYSLTEEPPVYSTHARVTVQGPAGEPCVFGYVGPRINHPGTFVAPVFEEIHAFLPRVTALLAAGAPATDFPLRTIRSSVEDPVVAGPHHRRFARTPSERPVEPFVAAVWLYWFDALHPHEMDSRATRPRIRLNNTPGIDWWLWYDTTTLEAAFRLYGLNGQPVDGFDHDRQPLADLKSTLSLSVALNSVMEL